MADETSARPTIQVHSEKIKRLEAFCAELGKGLDTMTDHLLQIIAIVGDTHPERELILHHVMAIEEALARNSTEGE